MMKTKITFHNMQHSAPMEEHANQKLSKLLECLKQEENMTPLFAELWLKANKQHPHHAAELHLKAPHFDLHAHDEGTDMYMVIDAAIEKMLHLIKKEKDRRQDKIRKPEFDKRTIK